MVSVREFAKCRATRGGGPAAHTRRHGREFDAIMQWLGRGLQLQVLHVAVLVAAAAAATSMESPNFLIFFVDDMVCTRTDIHARRRAQSAS